MLWYNDLKKKINSHALVVITGRSYDRIGQSAAVCFVMLDLKHKQIIMDRSHDEVDKSPITCYGILERQHDSLFKKQITVTQNK